MQGNTISHAPSGGPNRPTALRPTLPPSIPPARLFVGTCAQVSGRRRPPYRSAEQVGGEHLVSAQFVQDQSRELRGSVFREVRVVVGFVGEVEGFGCLGAE